MTVRRALILLHRYLGIALCLFCAMWFATGIVMIYAREMPGVTPRTRVDRLVPLDMARVRITAAEAAEKAGLAGGLDTLTLLTVLDRPAYRIEWTGATIFADTGSVFEGVGPGQARTIAARFMNVPEARTRDVGTIDSPDQWTLSQRSAMPLAIVAVDDDAGTRLYVSQPLGEVVVMTTRRSRLLAMAGAIPHWLYFTFLRVHNGLWRQVIFWTSGLSAFLVLTGIVVGLVQLRRRRQGRGFTIPYRGLLRWHHVTGLIFGVLALTWLVSGFFSMEPWFWASDDGSVPSAVSDSLSGGLLELPEFPLSELPRLAEAAGVTAIKEVRFARVLDAQGYFVLDADGVRHLLAAGTLTPRLPFPETSLIARVRRAVPEAPIEEAALIQSFDSYYYTRDRDTVDESFFTHGDLPLPVLRVKLGDPLRTWLYLDPATGTIKQAITRRGRLQRWIFNGLHSLDFSFWYYSRPAWDIGIISLLVGGLVLSVIGTLLAAKRLV